MQRGRGEREERGRVESKKERERWRRGREDSGSSERRGKRRKREWVSVDWRRCAARQG